MGVPTTGRATIIACAPAERVYDLVSDVTRMGEWSPECRRCEWLEGATTAAVGARFQGHNQLGPRKWATTAEVIAAERGREFAFTVEAYGRPASTWRYTFEPVDDGTLVTESYETLWVPWFARFVAPVIRRERMLAKGLATTLARVKAAAER